MEQFLQDLRFGARLLWKNKGFTTAVILTLGVCIGANAAVFSIVNAVLLRPLPFPDADRLTILYNSYPKAGVERASNAVPDYYDRLRETTVFEEQALYNQGGQTIGGHGDAERVDGMQVTPSLFGLLRVQPLRGRTFTEEEGEVGREQRAVLSYGLWQRLYAGRDDAIGQDIRLGGVPHTIVGVLPRDFMFLSPDVQVWTPLAFTPRQKADDQHHNNSYEMVARLKPGASIERARQELDTINARNLDRLPALKDMLVAAGFHTKIFLFQEDLVRDISGTLYLLWGGALLVLLIGCVNTANLVMARSSVRLKEMATRHVLGAGLGRLTRQIVTETTLLTLAGGVVGLTLGYWALDLIHGLGLEQLPRAGEIRMDASVVLFTLGVALAIGVILGLVPAVSIRKGNLNQAFRDEGRTGTAGRTARFLRRALATAQVALALMLLVGAGLLFASFRRVLAIDPGFATSEVVTAKVNPPPSRYKDNAAVRTFTTQALNRIRTLPGVTAAGATSWIPFSTDSNSQVIMAEGYVPAPGESFVAPARLNVSDGYFEAMRVPLVRGRYFEPSDTQDSPAVVIVDERLAARFWPNADPVGRRMFKPEDPKAALHPTAKTPFFTVVGVVKSVKLTGLTTSTEADLVGAFYFPATQAPFRNITFAARSALEPTSLVSAMRRELAAVDPEVPLFDVRTMTERMDASLTNRRTPMVLALAFGAVALFLAAIGIYGVLAYQVAQRRREIGIRMAVGSDAASIFGLVIREGMGMVAVGFLLGLAGALAMGRVLESQLYGVRPMDPAVTSLVAVGLAVVALIACLVPARRASRVDPLVALSEP